MRVEWPSGDSEQLPADNIGAENAAGSNEPCEVLAETGTDADTGSVVLDELSVATAAPVLVGPAVGDIFGAEEGSVSRELRVLSSAQPVTANRAARTAPPSRLAPLPTN